MLDPGFKDAVVTEIEIHLDWMDRLRVLLHGHLHVRAFVQTEDLVGGTKGESRVTVPRIWDRRSRQLTTAVRGGQPDG